MTYMSFCRLNHYTDYLSGREGAIIEPVLWMCLVIISFRSTFQMKGAHRTTNAYFKVLQTRVRRRLHVIITRYMEQECHCQNHIQCDIFPAPLTTEMILPSYQHFIQYLHQKGYTTEGGSIPTESGALNRYAETITMIVLARVNGYYSPHFPMSVMEEEDRAFHNTNFSYAETGFFTNKLKQAYPKIDTESLTNAINFLERQKEANCPCSIHTQKRAMTREFLIDYQINYPLTLQQHFVLILKKMKMNLVLHLKTIHLLISLQITMESSFLECKILQMTFP